MSKAARAVHFVQSLYHVHRATTPFLEDVWPEGAEVGAAGLVCATADRGRAVFLGTQDITALQQSVDLVLQRPTVAGAPLDVAAFERLARALELADVAALPVDTDLDPIVLSVPEQDALDLLQHQAAVRAGLPQRIRYTCTACGLARTVNPARQATAAKSAKSAADQQQAGRLFGTMSTAAELLGAGHPFLATFSLLSAFDESSPQSAGTPDLTCERCDGNEYDAIPITYCPGCREPRDETVLLTCPDCSFDFAARAKNPPFWSSPEVAAGSFWLTSARISLASKVAEFENGMFPGQRAALDNALTKDDRLVAMFRCRFPGQTLRSVAVLITSQALVWTRQSLVSQVSSGRIDWSLVTRLRPTGLGEADKFDCGIEIATDTELPTRLIDFRGVGLSLTGATQAFDLPGVYRLVSRLVTAGSPAAHIEQFIEPVVPPPAPLQLVVPAPTPAVRPPTPAVLHPAVPPLAAPPPLPQQRLPPGWYQDPWRQAMVRWWDGVTWTAHTR